jgi:hypothetical protein
MEIDRFCACGEEANCYCKLCTQWYCWEHHCHHLQVAHESNSYSIRLDREIDENQTIRECVIQTERSSSNGNVFNRSGSAEKSLLLSTLQPLGSYSEQELQELHDYYRTQARRVRNELERRALFDSGVTPTDFGSYFLKQQRVRQNISRNGRNSNNRTFKQSKSLQTAQQTLLDSVRSGILSLAQIESILLSKNKP